MATDVGSVDHASIGEIGSDAVVKESQQKIFVISMSDAIHEPWAIVIHFQNVLTHDPAIMNTIWLEFTFVLAPSVSLSRLLPF